MLVGWREPHRRLNAYRVRLHEDVFGDLAALCRPAVDRIQNYKERLFENFAELDDKEYFWYAHATLPSHVSRSANPEDDTPTVEDDSADLVRIVRSADALQEASRDDLDEGGYSFYSICWPHRGSMMGFVSRKNPIACLNPGFRYFQFGNAMRTTSRPDFALREGADLVVGAEGTAILSPYSFTTLLADVGVSFDDVSNDVVTVKTALIGSVRLTPAAEEALLKEASRTRSNAKRLRLLPDRLRKISLDAASLRRSLISHDVDPDLLFDENNDFSFSEQNVGMFFDVIEGRYFEDDLGGEQRRADRFSTR
jgi:hypothetical protein